MQKKWYSNITGGSISKNTPFGRQSKAQKFALIQEPYAWEFQGNPLKSQEKINKL